MKAKMDPWPKEVQVSKGDFQPYLRFSDLVKSDEYKKTMKLWEENRKDILTGPRSSEQKR